MPSTFWDPGAFAGPPRQDADRAIAIRTAIPDDGSGVPPGVSPWEVIYFAGIRAPGVCTVTGGRRRIVDPRAIPGSSGQIPAVMRYGLAEFIVTLTLWTPAQFDAFEDLVEFLYPKPIPAPATTPFQQFATPFGQNSVPNSPSQPILVPNSPLQRTANGSAYGVDVTHPAFKAIGVTSVYIVDIRVPVPGPVPQTMVATIDCVEFLPPVNEGVQPIVASVNEVSPGIFAPPGGAAQQQSQIRTMPPSPDQTSTGPG